MKSQENFLELILADLHISPFREEKFKTQKMNAIEWLIQYFADILKQKEERVYAQMIKIIRERSITIGIVNGDLMESSATERGLKEELDYKAARIVKEWLETLLCLKILLNMGNHESGYNLPLSTDILAGISKKSFENFLRLVGRNDLYYSFDVGDYRVIFIPYLFTEDSALDFDINAEKSKFLEMMAKDFDLSDKVIVLTHDPDSLDDTGLRDILETNRDKIQLFFCGHYHSAITLKFVRVLIAIFNDKLLAPYRVFLKTLLWFATAGDKGIVKKIEEYFRKRKNIPRLMKEFNVKIIPSPVGLFGWGGGFLVVNLETLEIKLHKA